MKNTFVKNLSIAIFSLCFIILYPKPASAQTATTFPVDEAGIAAYVKLNDVDAQKVTEAANVFSILEKAGDNYVIGIVNDGNVQPHVYLGLDGWIVAYFLKNDAASKMLDNRSGTLITNTTLGSAIDKVASAIGSTYNSDDIKYYDFAYPQANKMTIASKRSVCCSYSAAFYATVPVIPYEASYTYTVEYSGNYRLVDLTLKLDDLDIVTDTMTNGTKYGFFNKNDFVPNVAHLINLTSSFDPGWVNLRTVLIY